MTYTYYPHSVGGTEIYVTRLINALQKHNIAGVIAAPGNSNERYLVDGLEVWRFAISQRPEMADGEPDVEAAQNFLNIIDAVRPDILHLHALTSAVSPLLLKIAKDRSISTIFTYHTPTASCTRGTMLYRGKSPCHGQLALSRCTACTLHSHGLTYGTDRLFSMIPVSVGRILARVGLRRGPFLALRMRSIVHQCHERFRRAVLLSDGVMAVCTWVHDVLRANQVDAKKVRLSRHGLSHSESNYTLGVGNKSAAHLKIAFFGRLEEGKGVDVLIEAVRLANVSELKLQIYGLTESPHTDYYKKLLNLSVQDSRIEFHAPVRSGDVVSRMQEFDLIAVPSTLLETGPLVVLEAFAAGIPVIASKLGGMAELVADDVSGKLIRPGDAQLWAAAIREIAEDRSIVERWKRNISRPRTMETVAEEISDFYAGIHSDRYWLAS